MSTQNLNIDLIGKPYGGKRVLVNVVTVEYRTNFIKHDFNAQDLHLRPGDQVIVDTTKGAIIAKVCSHVRRELVARDEIRPVLRLANEADIARADRNEAMERQAYHFGVERVRERRLPLKLVRAQYIQDGSRIIFYFSAEGRIDFRDLVKDLAHRFRTRIEMHQIGVRDGTRMIGGIGSCGRELCCSTFLENFAPVSIRMARDQGLTLNPTKVSGMCGRLMCCLVYEQQVYRRARKRLPRAGQKVDTPDGVGKVLDLNVVQATVYVELEDTNRRTYPASDLELHDPKRKKTTVDAEERDYLWDDLDPQKSKSGDREESGGRRRNRRRKKGDGSKDGQRKGRGRGRGKGGQNTGGQAKGGQNKGEQAKGGQAKSEGEGGREVRQQAVTQQKSSEQKSG